MTESLWDSTAEELLGRASSREPTPGGGAIAAVTAAFGVGLVLMAIEVTISSAQASDEPPARLADGRRRAVALQADIVAAADRDVAVFDALMTGYRMPRESDDEQDSRRRAIDDATMTATHAPLELAESAVSAMALSEEIEPWVKPTIVSDIQAGRDLLRGAALAALRTADINLAVLEQRAHPQAPALRARRDALQRCAAAAEKRS